MFIPFGEWAPDSPALVGAARTATNCIGESNYYRPFKSFGVVTGALGGRAFGAISFSDSAGTTFTFAGDATKLYSLSANVFSNVSKAGNYNTLTDGSWKFAKFGNNVIATNYLDNVQNFDLSSPSLFADLAGTPPRAKHIAIVGDFVVLGNLIDGTFGVCSNSVRWSGINNPATWTSSASTQSDGQILENGDGGAVQGIVGGPNYGIIIQERCIQRMNYVGSPQVFTFDVLKRKHGTQIPNSIIGVGSDVFYIADDGFYRFDGVQVLAIGNDKVNKWFLENFDLTYKDRLSASIDVANTIVMWAFTTNGAGSGGNPNRILCYNWISGKFTLIEQSLEILFQALTLGLTLEELDDISTDLDALPFSLDSDAYKGGKLLAGAFNTDHKVGYFNGDDMTAVIETTEFEGAKSRFSEINQAMPMIEGDDDTVITARWGTRNNRNDDDVTYGSSLSTNSQGYIQTRANARFHRVEHTIAGGFTKATGIEIDDEQIRIGAKR